MNRDDVMKCQLQPCYTQATRVLAAYSEVVNLGIFEGNSLYSRIADHTHIREKEEVLVVQVVDVVIAMRMKEESYDLLPYFDIQGSPSTIYY
ncbi:hypothetical protein J6590_065619 [Homalodisca vitripennis]|nr:hypothetical protein J6590_065619 [Homalodisca vitripennis]